MSPEDNAENRKSVLLIINGTDYGGSETALAQIATALDRRGHRVHVLSLKPLGRVGRLLSERGIPTSSLGMAEEVGFFNLIAGTRQLRRWLDSRRFDVMHSFLPRANVMSRVANRFSDSAPLHISSERSTDYRRSWLVSRLNRYTARWTDLILAVSPAVRGIVVSRDGLPPDKIGILENGIDLDALDAEPAVDVRREIGLDSGDLLLCSAGRLVPDKGHGYLLQALANRARSANRTHLILVGDGPEEASLRRQAARLDLEKRVHFLGYRQDLIGILKGVDVFALPSLEEGVPVVALEAMACSVPVIATHVGGVPDLIVDGETGLLVPPAERWHPGTSGSVAAEEPGHGVVQDLGVVALAGALARVVGDRGLRSRMAEAGRSRVERDFSLEVIVSRLEAIYGRAPGSRPSPADQDDAASTEPRSPRPFSTLEQTEGDGSAIGPGPR